ncbi:MAG: CHAT domain-containing protein [Oscillatoriales cyanobacterium RM2_1_1]|nr:CHAT domain-containing protein [Oscillatoriales cyanobacterium SM2_3_0]NJO45004.1 CHAT domain-containing protein [Oscillatoriales cyanobacterium RM2_1_1]
MATLEYNCLADSKTGLMANNRIKLMLQSLALTTLLSTPSGLAIPPGSRLSAQQPPANSAAETRARAVQLFEQGFQLYQQGTGESLPQALEKLQAALLLFRELGDKQGEAPTLLGIGRIYEVLGDPQKALEFYNLALPLHQTIGDSIGEAANLNNIGGLYDALGESQKALEFYNQSLRLFQALEDREGEATTLNNLGHIHSGLGEKQKALEFYNQSLRLLQALGDSQGEAITLNNIGNVYNAIGEKQDALEFLYQSLALSRAVGNRTEAAILNNIGLVYASLGERQKALDFYNQALSVKRALGDSRGEATTLNNIGTLYDALGEPQKAVEFHDQALSLRRAVGDTRGEATTLNNLGLVYDTLGEPQKALEFYNQALSLRRAVGDPRGEATTLNNIGTIYFSLEEQQKALEFFSQSLPLSRAVGDRALEALSLTNIAVLERSRGKLEAALQNIEAAIAILEDLRTEVNSPELKTAFFATTQNKYEFYIDLLMELHQQPSNQMPDQGFDARALHISERSKARTLLELLQEANANIREGIDAQLLAQEKLLQQKLDAVEKRRLELSSQAESLDEQQIRIQQQQKTLTEQYQALQSKIRATSPNYAALTQPEPLTLAQIQQQVLDEETVLLQYALGKNRSYLWVVGKNSFNSYILPPRLEIETAIRSFSTALNNPRATTSAELAAAKTAEDLSNLILQPAAAQLDRKRLLVVADGALQYIPFAALAQPESPEYQPLILNHEIVNSPSASTIAILRQETQNRQSGEKTIAVLADPVFNMDDERVSTQQTIDQDTLPIAAQQISRSAQTAGIDWNRLPGTRQEAQVILELVPEAERTEAFDFNANRDWTQQDLTDYQIIHLATHGFFDAANPALSGIVLSLVDQRGNWQNGYLRLHEIFNLKLPAELIVLSACQTALGDNIRGEGLVGITRGFMYAGTPRVMSTLWQVDDKGTAELISRFYHKLLIENLSPAAALRSAQIELWQIERWRSPHFWASFTLQGEWQ